MERSRSNDDRYVAIMTTCRHPQSLRTHSSMFWISVTVDPLLCKTYSHIRLIIVYAETRELADMQIDRSAFTSLEHRLRGMSAKATHQAISKRSSPKGVICTVILKLTYDFLPDSDVKMSKLTLLSSTDTVDQRMRVGYESIHPITSTSNVLYEPLANSHNRWDPWFEEEFDDNWYLISILPPSHYGQSTMAKSVPPKILTAIVREALGSSGKRFHPNVGSRVLSYALVCKSWLHVCDLYWECIGQKIPYGRARLPLQTAVRFLEQKPYLARCFQRINDGLWKAVVDPRTTADWHPNLVLFRKLVTMAGKNLSNLVISPDLFFHMSEDGPLPLKGLTILFIRDMLRPGLIPNGFAHHLRSILDLQHLLKECKSLSTLRFYPPGSIDVGPYEGPNGPPPPYTLTRIELGNIYISHPQLLYLLSGPSGPRVTELVLKSVKGLTNPDLVEIFTIVRSTLRRLTITGCQVQPPEPGDELALDASIASMSALHDVDVGSNIASILALERRRKESGEPRKRSSISIHGVDPLHFLDSALTGAMEVTLWRSVHLSWACYPIPQDIRAEIIRARRVAFKRGIKFQG